MIPILQLMWSCIYRMVQSSIADILDLKRTLDPLRYILFFLHGEEGWCVSDGSRENSSSPNSEFSTISKLSLLMLYNKANRNCRNYQQSRCTVES